MHFQNTFISSFIAFLGAVSATPLLKINNWCNTDVYIWIAASGVCNTGQNGICDYKGGRPIPILAHTICTFPHLTRPGNNIKISLGPDFNKGVLQYEYTIAAGQLYWDLSNLDGAGQGKVGSPFFNHNVKITPTGKGSGIDKCKKFRCPKGMLCPDAYNGPYEEKTRSCPADTGTMWLDLCEPMPWFGNKRTVNADSVRLLEVGVGNEDERKE